MWQTQKLAIFLGTFPSVYTIFPIGLNCATIFTRRWKNISGPDGRKDIYFVTRPNGQNLISSIIVKNYGLYPLAKLYHIMLAALTTNGFCRLFSYEQYAPIRFHLEVTNE